MANITFEYDSNEEYDYDDLLDALTAYVDSVDKADSVPAHFDGLHITGENLGWQHRTGTASVELDAVALAQFLVAGMDCRLDGKWDPDTHVMTVTRYHHDAPTGEHLTLVPSWACEDTGNLQAPDAVNYAPAMNALLKNIGRPENCHKLSWDGLRYSMEADPWYPELKGLDNPTLEEVHAIINKEPAQ